MQWTSHASTERTDWVRRRLLPPGNDDEREGQREGTDTCASYATLHDSGSLRFDGVISECAATPDACHS